jgi:N-acetylglucosamine-6-phosphate deacetylase
MPRMFADQTDRLRQGEGVILGVGDAECGIQQAGGIVADAEDNAFTLAQAIRLVSKHPAQALGLDDRGVIAAG